MTTKKPAMPKPLPPGLSRPLQAPWRAGKGDWDGAHALVQSEENAEANWVHAYLHRLEGDAGNAAYWYARARKPVSRASLDAEWAGIVEALL